jgi:hypothetical protein
MHDLRRSGGVANAPTGGDSSTPVAGIPRSPRTRLPRGSGAGSLQGARPEPTTSLEALWRLTWSRGPVVPWSRGPVVPLSGLAGPVEFGRNCGIHSIAAVPPGLHPTVRPRHGKHNEAD